MGRPSSRFCFPSSSSFNWSTSFANSTGFCSSTIRMQRALTAVMAEQGKKGGQAFSIVESLFEKKPRGIGCNWIYISW